MDGWSPCYVKHHQRQEQKFCKFSSIHTWYILWVLCGQYAYGPFAWLFVQWCINLIRAHIKELRGVSTSVWVIEAHGTACTSQGRAKSAPVLINSHMVHPLCVMWPVCMCPPCLFACIMVYQHHPCTHWWIFMECQYLYGWLELMVHCWT